MDIEKLKKIHNQYFSLGYLNTDINTKFALISLICYVTTKVKEKNPKISYVTVIKQITKGFSIEESVINMLAIICEDFAYGCTQFPTFNIKPKDMISTIQNILKSYTPF